MSNTPPPPKPPNPRLRTVKWSMDSQNGNWDNNKEAGAPDCSTTQGGREPEAGEEGYRSSLGESPCPFPCFQHSAISLPALGAQSWPDHRPQAP